MNRNFLACMAASLMLSACGSGIDTNADWDPTANFGTYQTYAWVDGAYSSGLGDLVDSRIQAAIESNLNAKGLRKATSGRDADLGVGFQVTTQDRTTLQTVSSGWPGGYYGGYGYGGWGGGSSTTYTQNYTEGSLIIGLFDTDSQKMVWQGVGTKTLSGGSQSPEDREKNINEAVAKIMSEFPPGS
ncbi:MAG: DUF4136 domain-containing protein [Gemmatimonadota bacterium]